MGDGDAAPGTWAEALSYEYAGTGAFGVPDDLLEPADLTREDRRVKTAVVHGILDVMGAAQRDVLRHSFGIGDVLVFGHGDQGDDHGLAAGIGSTVPRVRDARTKGLTAFAKRYVKTVAVSDPDRADELTAAASLCLSAGGRK